MKMVRTMRHFSIRTAAALTAATLLPLSALAYPIDYFSATNPADQYEPEDQTISAQDIDAQCREELGLPEADIPYGSLRFNLRRCITTKRKEYINQIRAERIRNREQNITDTIINPKAEELKRRTTSAFRKAYKLQQRARESFYKDALDVRRQKLLDVRSQRRSEIQEKEEQYILDVRKRYRLQTRAQRYCQDQPASQRAACIELKMQELEEALE